MKRQVRELARGLIKKHGELLEVHCQSRSPYCRIELVFADGHEVVVGRHSGRIDISMLKFGYAGAGPTYFQIFLNEADFDVSYEQVATIEPPHTLRRGEPVDWTQGSISREELVAKGFTACELAQYAKARVCYAKAAKLYPGDSAASYNLGVVEYRVGNFEAAAEAFKRVVELKENLVVGALGLGLCQKKLERPFELPAGYTGKPELFNVEAPMRNIAHELRNRGYDVEIVVEPEYSLCRLEIKVDSVTYKLSLQSFVMGMVSEGFWRQENGREVNITDESVYPNPTETDKEFLAFRGKLSWFRLAQMPVGVAAMLAEKYRELTKARDLEEVTQEHGPYRWTRRGKTYEETDAEHAAKLGPSVKYTRVFNWSDLVKKDETGIFVVCALEGQPHLVAKVAMSATEASELRRAVEKGAVFLRTGCYSYPAYPIIYNRLFVPTGSGPRQGSYKGVLVESATDFTEANFQEWAVTLRRTLRMTVHVYNEALDHLATGQAEVHQDTVNQVIDAINRANDLLKPIPAEQRDFTAATRAFFRDHPEHFLFDSKQQSVRHGKSTEENQNELRSNGPEPLKTSGLQANKVYDWSKIIACHACGAGNPINATECIRCKKKLSLPKQHASAKHLTLTNEEAVNIASKLNHQSKKKPKTEKQIDLDLSPHPFNFPRLEFDRVKNRIEPSIEAETKFWQWLYQHRRALLAIFLFVLLLAGFIFKEEAYIVFIIVLMIAGFLTLGCIAETEDFRYGKQAERNAEQAKKDMRKKQDHLDMEVERITDIIRKKVKKNKPLENILPNIRTKDYEVLAKAISTIDFIKDTDKGCLFKNMNPDFISKVLAYFSEANEIAILRQIEPEKRKDVLFRCSLSKRNRLESVFKESEVSSQESNDSEDELNAEKSRDKMDLFNNKKKVDILSVSNRKVEACENCGRTIGKLEQAYVFKNHIVCQQCHEKLKKQI